MKRTNIALTDLASYSNLALATWKAARGKRQRPDVIQFTTQLDTSLNQLAADILKGNVPYGQYRQFYIHDPKRRLIHAAGFADRVLHHALMNLAEDVFERTLVATSYACRPHKGVHKAVLQVQKNLQRYPWFVKIDIDSYFATIDHSRLMALLEKRFKGQDFLALLYRIIDSYHIQPNKGLPIGSLTSQHFANYYLDGADRFLLVQPSVSAHVRYMDDMIWWCHDKASCRQTLTQLDDYLSSERLLKIKANWQINRSLHGLTYCGYRILPAVVRLSTRKKRRYQSLRQQWESRWRQKRITSLKLQEGYAAVHAISLHAASRPWRKRNLQIHPSCYDNEVG